MDDICIKIGVEGYFKRTPFLKKEKVKIVSNCIDFMKEKSRHLLIISVFLFVVFSSRGQGVSGYVFEKSSGEPLVGVTVYNQTLKTGTTTDKNGYFQMSLAKGKYLIDFSFVGYNKKSEEVTIKDREKRLKVILQETSSEIASAIITAKSEARQVREQAMPVAVISMKEIQGSVSDINEVLEKTAGVKLRRSGGEGSVSRISVRGLEGKRIGFFIDETPMTENSEFVDINDIPVEFIERIEVYKGVVPAKFGGSAVGGAVNIVIKDFPPRYLDLSYSLKSYNTQKVSAVTKINNQDRGVEFGFGGFYTYADNNYKMKNPYKNGLEVERDHDRFEKKVIGAPVKLTKLWFDEINIEPVFMQTQKQIQGIRHNIQHAETGNDTYIIATGFEKNDFFLSGLDFDFDIGYVYSENTFVDTSMQRYFWDLSTYEAATKYGGEIGEDANNADVYKQSISNKLNLNYLFNGCHALNLNMQYNFAYGNPRDPLKELSVSYKTSYPSYMNSLVTGLTHEMHSRTGRFLSALSAKYYFYDMDTKNVKDMNAQTPEKVDVHKHDWGISYSFRYKFSTQFLAKFSAAYDVRLPAEDELLGDGFMIVPATDLTPERNRNMNLGIMYDKLFVNESRLQFEANVFANKLTNMIRFAPGGNLQAMYVNFGEMRTLGADAEVKWDANDMLYMYANITYQDLRDTREYEPDRDVKNHNKGDRMPNIPYLYSNAGIELHKQNLFGGKGQNSRLMVDASFVEEYYYSFKESAFEEEMIPQAFTVDVGLEHSFKNQQYILGLQVNNVGDADIISEFKRPLPGRTYAIKLRYILK